MDAERWKRIDEIFHAVLDREPSARAAFLKEACEGDDSLRREIERLIACHEKKSNLFERPPSDLAAALLAKQDTYKDTISHYRILRKIGRGGMGEVYLAEDTRLNRKVALKLLPLEFTKDKERIRRFEQEARAISALNHPNILTIYDIGQAESSSFIASEYIEGETLRQRMRISKMPLKEILPIVIQVAEALDAAHRAGIIHRDIKPENIMLRKDGYVKVLDFGLAKLTESQPISGDSHLETLARTQTGVVIGTVRYMSPEQARGLKVDARTDIFSLGVVLYELIAGRVPFDGATSSDMLAAILEKHPPALRTYGEFPEELQWIVTKALAKDTDERYQTVKELLTDLKRLRKRLEMDEELKRSDSSATALSIATPKRVVVIALIVLVTISVLGLLLMRHEGQINSKPQKPFSKIKLTRLTSSGLAWRGIISPDGKYVAYLQEDAQGQQSLYVKQLAADTEMQILKLPPKTYFQDSRFSHDGEFIFYVTFSPDKDVASLYKIPVFGGISRKVIDDIDFVPTISPDGKKLAFVRSSKEASYMMIAQADGSDQRKIGSHKFPDRYTDAAWSPDGKIVASILDKHAPFLKQIVGIYLDDGVERPLFDLKWSSESDDDLEWLSDGTGLILAKETEGKRQIYHLSYPNGELTAVSNDPNDYAGVSLTKDSKFLVTTQVSHNSTIWVASSADPNVTTQLTSGTVVGDGNTGLSWTPDGKILYNSRRPSGEYQLCLINPDGTNPKQITTGQPSKYWPIASPDGRYIVYMTEDGRIWRMESNGGDSTLLLADTKNARFPRFSPDSRWILYSTYSSEKQDLINLPLDGAKEVTLASHELIYGGAISPNGSRIAYVYEDPQRPSDFILNIISSENGAPSKNFRLEGNAFPNGRIHWTPDGRGIAYMIQENETINIYVQPLDGSPLRRLTSFKTETEAVRNFAWSLDGKRIAYSRGKASTYDVVLIENLP